MEWIEWIEPIEPIEHSQKLGIGVLGHLLGSVIEPHLLTSYGCYVCAMRMRTD